MGSSATLADGAWTSFCGHIAFSSCSGSEDAARVDTEALSRTMVFRVRLNMDQ